MRNLDENGWALKTSEFYGDTWPFENSDMIYLVIDMLAIGFQQFMQFPELGLSLLLQTWISVDQLDDNLLLVTTSTIKTTSLSDSDYFTIWEATE